MAAPYLCSVIEKARAHASENTHHVVENNEWVAENNKWVVENNEWVAEANRQLMSAAFPFVAQFEVAEATGVVEVSDIGAQADDATDALDGEHERRGGKTDSAGVAAEEGEELLLLRDMPAAIARGETVGVVPPQLMDALLESNLHLVGSLLGNHGTQRVGNEHTHHVALLLQLLLIGFVAGAAGADEEGVGFRPS